MTTVRLSDNLVVETNRSCHNRSRSALSGPVIVPDGFKADGSKRFRTIRTEWKDADRGLCQYALTDEGKADAGCSGCIWRNK
ncbi:hypothetical protein [Marinobacter sp.]|uniref:hypothetical protein n=1 Tax=Marinobacter sp. TaxID=50741 RepID=UPI003A927BA4